MTRDRTAALVGGIVGILGIVAGLTATAWGTSLGTWAGAKQDPMPLGLLTTALSVLALAVSVDLYRADSGTHPARRAAITTGQLLPGLLGSFRSSQSIDDEHINEHEHKF